MAVAVRCGECFMSWREGLPVESACEHLQADLFELPVLVRALRDHGEAPPTGQTAGSGLPSDRSATFELCSALVLSALLLVAQMLGASLARRVLRVF